MAQKSPKEKSGGICYEVILAPASSDTAPRPASPPKERPISQEVIDLRMNAAEERRRSVEASKLAAVTKDKERAQEVVKRAEELNDSFSKTAEKRLSAKFEAADVRKDLHYKELQERLKEHAKRVEQVRQVGDRYKVQLQERIGRKMENMEGNRATQLNAITERIKEHEKHIKTVLDASQKKLTKVNEEQIIAKMETTLKNREQQLRKIQDRLQEHEKHCQKVRVNKQNQPEDDETS